MRKSNGFTLLKLICAIQVFYGHAVAHLDLNELVVGDTTIIRKLLSPFQGVPIFFGLSGYFIWNSLSKKKQGVAHYTGRRFTRIFPELWIVVGISVILILILDFRELSFPPFLVWIFTQSTFMQFWTPDCLRGYGVGCPNGSLWTITIFIQFYIAVYILHKFLHKGNKLMWGGVILLGTIFNVVPGHFENIIPEIIYKLYQQTLFPYIIVFMIGAYICEFKEEFKFVLDNKFTPLILYIILFVGLPFDLSGAGYNIIRSAVQVLFAIGFGEMIRFDKIKRDVSYEIYLLHMIIINLVIELNMSKNWITFFGVLFLTITCASILHRINERIVRQLEIK